MAETILLIEDDEAIRFALKTKLKKDGYEVIEATDGRQGLTALRDNKNVAVILLDILMPEADGIAFLREKSADVVIKDIPVIVVTNLSDPENTKKITPFNVKGYLIKAHHSIESIITEMQKVLRGEQAILEI